jgi:hypothetical protein
VKPEAQPFRILPITRYVLLMSILALLVLPACGGDDEEAGGTGNDTITSVETEETTTVETTTEETTTEEEPAGPITIRIAYKGGKLSGDTGTVRIPKGEKVRLIVRADIEEEVHLHGYDLAAEVAPGHPARINFEADQRGKFIAELEHMELHIVTLRVTG